MRICRDLKGVIVGWVRLLGGSVTMSKGGFVRVSVKDKQGMIRENVRGAQNLGNVLGFGLPVDPHGAKIIKTQALTPAILNVK